MRRQFCRSGHRGHRPGVFHQFYRSIDLGAGGAIFLAHREGLVACTGARTKGRDRKIDRRWAVVHKIFAGGRSRVLMRPPASLTASPHRGLQGHTGLAAGRGGELCPQRGRWRRGTSTCAPRAAGRAIVVVILFGTWLLVRQVQRPGDEEPHSWPAPMTVSMSAISNMSQGTVPVRCGQAAGDFQQAAIRKCMACRTNWSFRAHR